MKKLLTLLTCLLLLTSLQGQILKYSNYVAPVPPEPPEPTEMLTNGALTAGTSWDVYGYITLTNNRAEFSDEGVFSQLVQAGSTMAARIEGSTDYILTFTVVTNSTTGTLNIGIQNEIGDWFTGNGGLANYSDGTHNVSVTSPSSVNNGGIQIVISIMSSEAGYIDNLSLIEDI